MGSFSNMAANAAAEAQARQKEMNDLCRGKNSEQQAIIKFFYGSGKSFCKISRPEHEGYGVEETRY